MFSFFVQSFGLFQHPGAYDEPEYHSLSQDAQNQPPFLENSPEFYAGMLEQKYNQPYHKNPFNSRGKRFNLPHCVRQISNQQT